MVFPYYHRLSRRQQAIYRESDGIDDVPVPRPAELREIVERLHDGLDAGSQRAVQNASIELVRELLRQLGAPPVKVRVLAVRPSTSASELHGLYESEEGETPVLRVWMRTAAREEVVAFRTFVRTLLHEVCHHLDYEHFALADSFHTEGFLRRESSLMRQLCPKPEGETRPAPAPDGRSSPRPRRPAVVPGAGVRRRLKDGAPTQLDLPW